MNVYEEVQKGLTEYDNWRYLKNVKATYTNSFEGLASRHKLNDNSLFVLLGNYYTGRFPKLNIIEFLNMNPSPSSGMILGKSTGDEYIFPYCTSCCGAGKFDWVSRATCGSPFFSRYEFKRDKSVVLLYHEPDGGFSEDIMWAPTEIQSGEYICDDCLGTGVDLSGRYNECDASKKNLVLVDIRHFIQIPYRSNRGDSII